jgi:hypothetical protein
MSLTLQLGLLYLWANIVGKKHKVLSQMCLSLTTGYNVWCSVGNKPKDNLITALTGRKTQQKIICTRHTCPLASCIFNWNTCVTGHKYLMIQLCTASPLPGLDLCLWVTSSSLCSNGRGWIVWMRQKPYALFLAIFIWIILTCWTNHKCYNTVPNTTVVSPTPHFS